MKDHFMEFAAELITIAGSMIGAAFFTVLGASVERTALGNILSGAVTIGAWELVMGSLALYVGIYLFGYREFWSRYQAWRSA